MRELVQNEVTAVQGAYTYWEPDLIVVDCDMFGCYETYYPGYWAESDPVIDAIVFGTFVLFGVIFIGAAIAA